MDDAGRANATCEKLRIDSNVRTGVHDDIPRRQNPFQEMALWTISIGFKSSITQAVEGKGVFVSPISNSAKERDRGHQRRVSVTVQKAAKKLGKRRLRARSTGNNMR